MTRFVVVPAFACVLLICACSDDELLASDASTPMDASSSSDSRTQEAGSDSSDQEAGSHSSDAAAPCTGRFERAVAALPWFDEDECFAPPEVLANTCAVSEEGGLSGNNDPICIASPQGELFLGRLDHGEELTGGYRHGGDDVFVSTLKPAEEAVCQRLMSALVETTIEDDAGSPLFFGRTLTICTSGT